MKAQSRFILRATICALALFALLLMVAVVVAPRILAQKGYESVTAPSPGVAAPTSAPVPASAAPPAAAAPQAAAPGATQTQLTGTNIDPTARKANILGAENGAHLVAYSDGDTKLVAATTFKEFQKILYGQSSWQPRNKSLPMSVTIELPQKYGVTRVGVQCSPNGFGIILTKVAVEASREGMDVGFVKLGEWPLENSKEPQEFGVTATEARWLRFTFPSAAATRKDYPLETREYSGQLRGLIARGARAEDLSARSVNLTGTWKGLVPATGWEDAHIACFEQKGSSVTGIVGADQTTYAIGIEGVVDSGVLAFRATRIKPTESYPTGAVGGLVINTDGDKLVGLVPRDPQKPQNVGNSEAWWYFKTSDRIQCKGFGSDAEAKSKLETDLEKSGKAIVYGILFDFDKDTIKVAESKPVLDEVVGLMKKHADWSFAVEGHTDSVGTDDYNLDLSKRRAAAVVKWLTDAGVEAKRLTSGGAGKSSPVASNETAAGRALNRRVEITKR